MNYKSRGVILLSVLIIAGCQNSKNSHDETIRGDFKKFTDQFFSNYEFNYVTKNSSNATEMSYIDIDKNQISNKQLDSIKESIEESGWKKIYDDQRYIQYCLNNNNSIAILNFDSVRHSFSDGTSIEVEDPNYISVTFYYNRLGVNDCENYFSSLKN